MVALAFGTRKLRQLRPCFDKKIIRAKCETGRIFESKMNLFLKQTCDAVLFCSAPNCYAIATQEYFNLKDFGSKYLIPKTLRLGSSVGRAED